ncbi:hypothetical protein QOT17_019907 [Balamuthia mandrillaris]
MKGKQHPQRPAPSELSLFAGVCKKSPEAQEDLLDCLIKLLPRTGLLREEHSTAEADEWLQKVLEEEAQLEEEEKAKQQEESDGVTAGASFNDHDETDSLSSTAASLSQHCLASTSISSLQRVTTAIAMTTDEHEPSEGVVELRRRRKDVMSLTTETTTTLKNSSKKEDKQQNNSWHVDEELWEEVEHEDGNGVNEGQEEETIETITRKRGNTTTKTASKVITSQASFEVDEPIYIGLLSPGPNTNTVSNKRNDEKDEKEENKREKKENAVTVDMKKEVDSMNAFLKELEDKDKHPGQNPPTTTKKQPGNHANDLKAKGD